MANRMSFIILFLTSLSLAVSAAPYMEDPLAPRQTTDCNSTDSETLYDASCWASLDLTNWLSSWHAPNTCTDPGNGTNCCLEDETWSVCFLRLGTGDSGYNCTQISVNTNDCTYSGALNPDLDPSIRAQVRYVLRTIFSMWISISNSKQY